LKKIIKPILFIFLPPFLIIEVLHYFGIISTIEAFSASLALFYNLINFGLVISLFEKSKKESYKKFLLLNLGGMVIRLIFLVLAVLISLIFLKIDNYAFILVFLIFYSVSLILEIKYFNSRN